MVSFLWGLNEIFIFNHIFFPSKAVIEIKLYTHDAVRATLLTSQKGNLYG